jgi:hypothetical protein
LSKNLTDASVPPPSSATVLQIQSTEHPVELAASQFNALLAFSGYWQLKDANFKPLVPNAKTISVPKQNLDPVTLTIEEQKQVARQWVLVKHPFGQTHQSIKAEVHVDRRRTGEDSQIR